MTTLLRWSRASTALLAGLTAASAALAQPSTSTPAGEDETVILPEFVVSEDSGGRYIGTNSLSATGAAIPVTDLPFSMSVITKELLEDAAVHQVSDLMKFVSGMQVYNRPYSDASSQTLRGFPGNVATDGVQTQTDSVTRDLSNVARIEVLKGPSAILFPRSGSAGGTVNVITKSPLAQQAGSAMIQVGQYNSNKAVVDYNGAPLANGKLLYRIVVTAQDADGFSETDFIKRTIIFPAFTYKFSDRSEVTVKYQYWDQSNSVPTGQGLGPHGEDDLSRPYFDFSLPRRRSFDDPELNYNTSEEHRYWITFNSKLSEATAFQLGYNATFTDANRLFTRPRIVGNAPLIAPDGTVQRTIGAPNFVDEDHRAFLDVTSVFSFFGTKHTVLYGGDFLKQTDKIRDPGGANFPATNAFAPPVGGHTNPLNMNLRLIPRRGSDLTRIYLMDIAKFWEDRVAINVGLTKNWNTGYTYNAGNNTYSQASDDEDAKQYGAVITPIPGIHLYGSYNENYQVAGGLLGIIQPDGTVVPGGPPPNRFNTNEEFGVKLNLLGDRLTLTASHFNILLTNRTRNILGSPLQEFLGDGYSKGVEFDLFYAPAKNLSLIATYSNFKTKDNNGIRFLDVPEETATLWARYDFAEDTALRGLGIGAGMSYSGDMINRNRNVFFTYEGRTLYDLALYYEWEPFRFQLNVQNLFNEDYYAGGSPPTISYRGPQRNIQFSVLYEF